MSVKVLHRGPDLIGNGEAYWVVLCGCGNKFITKDVWEFTDNNWTKALVIDANINCGKCSISSSPPVVTETPLVKTELKPNSSIKEKVSETVLAMRAEFATKVSLKTYRPPGGGVKTCPLGKMPKSERPGWLLWEEIVLREFKNVLTTTEIYEMFFKPSNAPYKKRSLEDVHGMALWVQETAPAP